MSIRLTQTVQKGGCAAKISAQVLRSVLSTVDFRSSDPNVLVDGRNFDDAGIYRVAPDLALVQTLDFFTPIVDTPFLFGQIASANALSDVYAMGGSPRTCMAILAFPLATLEPEVMTEVLRGAQSKIAEAGATMIGGHSIDDDTLKFGLSVTGLVNPSRMWANAGARPGDKLILTKALGTGTLTAGLKASDYREDQISDALESMAQLNRVEDLLDSAGASSSAGAIHAATDITGFGLMGHALQVARASGVRMRLHFNSLPVFERAFESLRADNLTRAHRTNREYTREQTGFNHVDGASVESQILFDPQTSGGLLLSVAAPAAEALLARLRARFPRAAIVGEVVTGSAETGPLIEVRA